MGIVNWMGGIWLITLVFAAAQGCEKRAPAKDSLKGQANSTLIFHGLAVDELGQPLDGVDFLIEVEAIPPDWTFDTRGKPHAFSTVAAKSGRDGRFQLEITGHVLRLKRAERAGYRHFYDLDTGDSRAIDNTFYMLNAWGDLLYKSDRDHPAVYVFVKDGAREVSALPCKGGYDSGNGTHWTLNKSGWPKKPSLKDIVRKQPTTRAQ